MTLRSRTPCSRPLTGKYRDCEGWGESMSTQVLSAYAGRANDEYGVLSNTNSEV